MLTKERDWKGEEILYESIFDNFEYRDDNLIFCLWYIRLPPSISIVRGRRLDWRAAQIWPVIVKKRLTGEEEPVQAR